MLRRIPSPFDQILVHQPLAEFPNAASTVVKNLLQRQGLQRRRHSQPRVPTCQRLLPDTVAATTRGRWGERAYHEEGLALPRHSRPCASQDKDPPNAAITCEGLNVASCLRFLVLSRTRLPSRNTTSLLPRLSYRSHLISSLISI
jgi:hypothetical protein